MVSGSGEEDYELLKKFLKPGTVRVVETHYRGTREELIKGLQFLREQGIAWPHRGSREEKSTGVSSRSLV